MDRFVKYFLAKTSKTPGYTDYPVPLIKQGCGTNVAGVGTIWGHVNARNVISESCAGTEQNCSCIERETTTNE